MEWGGGDETTAARSSSMECLDEWDQGFLNDVLRAEDEALAARASRATPLPVPTNPNPTHDPFSAFPHASSSAVGGGGGGFSPPRELSQRPQPPAADSHCEIVAVGTAGDCLGGGRRDREPRDWKEVGRLKRELNELVSASGAPFLFTHASKSMSGRSRNYRLLPQKLKVDATKKDLEIKAKDVEIQSLKIANVGVAGGDLHNVGMQIDPSSHNPATEALHPGGSGLTSRLRAEKSNCKNEDIYPSGDYLCSNQKDQTDASEVLELKRRIMIDNSMMSTSAGIFLKKENNHRESKKTKCKENTGIQTDLPWNSEHFECKRLSIERISSKLCATWAMPRSRLMGRDLISKILVSCSEELFALLHSTRLPDKCETSSEASSSMNDAISQLQGIFMKMHNETTSIQTLLEALLNLCAVGNDIAVGRALRVLHNSLRHFLNCGAISNQMNNVLIEPCVTNTMHKERNDHKNSYALMSTPDDAENLLKSYDSFYKECAFLPFTFWSSVFTVMLQIAVKHSEENIRVDALSIMILTVMRSDKGEREKFGFISVMESLHQLLQKENGLLVKKHSVYLLFLLLNCPKMLTLLCGGGKDGSEPIETVGCENDRSQQAISSIFEDLSECLTFGATGFLELKLCRQVIILLAYIASNGKLGYEVLLGPVTPYGANFLELITQVLAAQMEAEIPDSAEAQELLKERYLLMREALILLNRLASHPTFSKATLEVLISSKSCATLTIDVANRLPQMIRYLLRHLGKKDPQMEAEIADLPQRFRTRVYSFLGERHPMTDRSVPR